MSHLNGFQQQPFSGPFRHDKAVSAQSPHPIEEFFSQVAIIDIILSDLGFFAFLLARQINYLDSPMAIL